MHQIPSNVVDENTLWFALDLGGVVHALGSHQNFDAADEYAESEGIQILWLANFSTAMQWCDAILGNVHDQLL